MTSLSRSALAATTLFAGACVRQQPQVLTPVRIDTVRVAVAQPAREPAPAASADPFAPLTRVDLPGPNIYRSASGAPGPGYWQQRVDYTIDAALDTSAKSVAGSVTIRYTNHSPDTLRFVWLQLDQNLYATGSLGSALFPADSRFGVRGFQGGFETRGLTVDGRPAEAVVDDTRMRIELARPIPPRGGKATIAMAFSFRVPEHGSDRMGRDGTLYEIAQWYPRMAVYDDVRGWNTEPYLGQGEFYLEYGDIDFTVKVPAGFTVAASGILQNAAEVLSPEQRARLARAAKSPEVVQIITEAEAKAEPRDGTKSWKFRARNVRDVAWAAAPDFRWDATSWNGIVTQAYYQWPKAGAEWETMAEGTQWAIRTYSELFFPYPYPQATAVAGPVAGMEYPMFVMDGYTDPADPGGVFRTNDHEHGHEWFPMIVGSNERRYAWMDEGFNTYINAFSQERRYGADASKWPAGMDNIWSFQANWRLARERGASSPLGTPPDHVSGAGLGAVAYRKPAAVLLALRNGVVGATSFDAAFREYIRRWAFKHPTPGDFFRTVENVTGQELSWFWRAFIYSDDVLDIGIESVTSTAAADGSQAAAIALKRFTPVPFPVTLRLALADGSSKDVRLPVDIWARTTTFTAIVPVAAQVVGVRLWPDPSVPDFNAANDTWGQAPAANTPAPVTSGGLSGQIPSR